MNPSQSIPEGVETVNVEGADLARAIATAAESIGVDPSRVEFKFDLAHFRSVTGASVAKRTVRIIAWNTTRSDEEIAAAAAKRAPAPRRRDDEGGRDREERRDDRRDRDDRRESRERREREPREERREREPREERRERRPRRDADNGAAEPARAAVAAEDLEETEAAAFAGAWFTTLLGHMDIEGTVKARGNAERVQLWINAERAGRLIGKRGSTLGAIRHLLGLAVQKSFGDLVIDVDVEDNRPAGENGVSKPRDRERGERSERGDRGERRGRDRGGRDRGERRDNGGDRERSRYPEEKLRALARRAAEKAVETSKAITINLELNSYDRRIVHVEIAEIDGVGSRSEERDDGVKIIQVYPELAE